MRAARRADGKYIRNERIPDEAYRLDDDPGETTNLADSDDGRIRSAESALVAFEDRVGGVWNSVGTDDPLADMDSETKDRLRDLGYVE
jgi:hypothetical protein